MTNGEKEKERDEWLERVGSSRHLDGQSKGRQGMSVLGVTPIPVFIVFPCDFRVLSPWSRI